ncbi:MAG: rhomboid family intramembrane serine protease [bacterium]|nr:rhomboid family intramembrane serine protease [bacterium]
MLPIRDINPASTAPAVTVAIAGACAAVFLYQAAVGLARGPAAEQAFVYRHGVIPYAVARGVRVVPVIPAVTAGGPFPLRDRAVPAALRAVPVRGPAGALRWLYLPLLASMFLHGGVFHLGLNMLFLWIFGNNVEDAMGHARFLLFYLVCGVAASALHVAANPDSAMPTVGASGAIAGVMGAYIVLFPHARVLTLVPLFFYFTLVELPAFVFLGLWFLMQLLMARGGGNIAWYAHIGGFVAGLLLVPLFARRRRRGPAWY